jgi:hypothetical protein
MRDDDGERGEKAKPGERRNFVWMSLIH